MPYSFVPGQSVPLFAEEYLRQVKAGGHPLHLRHLGLTFYGLNDCLYFGDHNGQILLPPQGTDLRYIFRESCNYPASECTLETRLQTCLLAASDPLEIDEAAALNTPGMRNLWHWMTEGLPKLLALESIGYTGRYIVPETPVVLSFMEMLSIAPERLLPRGGSYRVKRLLLPQRLSGFDLVEYMPLVEMTRGRLLDAVGRLDGEKRVYVRRVGRRKPVNEEDVLAVLEDFGFAAMVPEDFSVPEQLRYMTNASCSVMAHGANAALTLMQPPRSAVVEFFSNRYVSYNNLHAVRLLRLRYHPLVEDLDVSSAPAEGMALSEFLWSGLHMDMAVDTRHLRVLLESILE
ncbi:hypothetical protein KL86DPRO_10614 [uncultured delta proteobacterium]|uniref:Glycosyltransferase 61 catalytic domain-containing protein n=1 Tax=uncultured delta proteobacterium TaxID=34034 RepID=A0A212J3A1_9DELT|nr:hypothetical protein KL86DPRO_10614 [uncultured delta proteobacterium]